MDDIDRQANNRPTLYRSEPIQFKGAASRVRGEVTEFMGKLILHLNKKKGNIHYNLDEYVSVHQQHHKIMEAFAKGRMVIHERLGLESAEASVTSNVPVVDLLESADGKEYLKSYIKRHNSKQRQRDNAPDDVDSGYETANEYPPEASTKPPKKKKAKKIVEEDDDDDDEGEPLVRQKKKPKAAPKKKKTMKDVTEEMRASVENELEEQMDIDPSQSLQM